MIYAVWTSKRQAFSSDPIPITVLKKFYTDLPTMWDAQIAFSRDPEFKTVDMRDTILTEHKDLIELAYRTLNVKAPIILNHTIPVQRVCVGTKSALVGGAKE